MEPTGESSSIRLLIFSASLRADSLNTKLAHLVATEATRLGATVDLATMREFETPSYDGDVEVRGELPRGAEELRRRLLTSDAFVIASPEYNASVPGLLKNTIDWTSRFRPQPFNGRYGLLLSASPSMVGGNRGLWALRVPLEHLGARLFPEMFSLAQAPAAFTAEGALANAGLAARLTQTLQAFLELVEAAKHYPCMKKAWVEFLGEPGDGGGRVDPAR